MDKELEKILLKFACVGCLTSCKVYRKLRGNCEERQILETAARLKSLFKKKAKECNVNLEMGGINLTPQQKLAIKDELTELIDQKFK